MSQAPNNPFESGPQQLGQPAQKGSNTWLWVLGIIGGLLLVGGLVCCGSVFYFGSKVSGLAAEVMVEQYAEDPILQEKIGTINSSSMNFGETGAESQKDENITAVVIDISGDKGSGKMIQRTDNRSGDVSVELIMENGERFDLEVIDEYEDFGDELEGLEDMEAMEEEFGVEEFGVDTESSGIDVTEEATAE